MAVNGFGERIERIERNARIAVNGFGERIERIAVNGFGERIERNARIAVNGFGERIERIPPGDAAILAASRIGFLEIT
jgi:hypothetical protein